jgi:hypothetical protein
MATKKPATSIQPKQTRRGYPSKKDIEDIKLHLKAGKTIDHIAVLINRSPNTVQNAVDKIRGAAPTPHSSSLVEQLQTRQEWKKWQQQFTKDELEQFKTHYVQLMGQFDNNVKPTEELQVFQVITLIILIDRTLSEQKQALESMERVQTQINKARKANRDDEVMMLEAQYEGYRAVQKTCADKYKTYSDKQDKLLQSLKSTREQRLKNHEDSDKSWIGLIKWLSEEENRERSGKEMELMRLAALEERKKMMAPHTYIDGTVDRPLLSHESYVEVPDEE